jgi:hypothetical protein
MIAAGLAGAWAWHRGKPHWPTLVAFSLGLLLYAGLNTASRAVLVSLPWVCFEMLQVAVVFALLGPALSGQNS